MISSVAVGVWGAGVALPGAQLALISPKRRMRSAVAPIFGRGGMQRYEPLRAMGSGDRRALAGIRHDFHLATALDGSKNPACFSF